MSGHLQVKAGRVVCAQASGAGTGTRVCASIHAKWCAVAWRRVARRVHLPTGLGLLFTTPTSSPTPPVPFPPLPLAPRPRAASYRAAAAGAGDRKERGEGAVRWGEAQDAVLGDGGRQGGQAATAACGLRVCVGGGTTAACIGACRRARCRRWQHVKVAHHTTRYCSSSRISRACMHMGLRMCVGHPPTQPTRPPTDPRGNTRGGEGRGRAGHTRTDGHAPWAS